MTLPSPNLDDLRFQQDLVDEARRRIVQYCPEWTDYNLSDPGITLIELFAWMTELMIYRLNRVPEKNYIKFMELLGVDLQPASSATTELTFRLSVPFPIDDDRELVAVVPAETEVATRSVEGEEDIVFTTDKRLVVDPPRLTHLRRSVDFARNYLPRLNVQECRVFRDQNPQEGDTFYLGFDDATSVAGYILRLDFNCREALATGIKRTDPPLVWECSMGDGEWLELKPSDRTGEKDTTGGLNNEDGQIVFYLPLSMRSESIQGVNAYWIRCRYQQRRSSQGRYTQSPRLQGARSYVMGATSTATHAIVIEDELVGTTAGEPGQRFQLSNAPILQPRTGGNHEQQEVLEVEERIQGEIVFVPWQRVKDFSESTRYDRHYVLNTSTGVIQFGPNIRHRDGTTQQYGRVPEAGRQARFTRYRSGGGTEGNVPPGRLNYLRSTIPYIDSVTNLRRAEGGRDAETLDEAKIRAPKELSARTSAVTAGDFVDLALRASRKVARVEALTPNQGDASPPPGTVALLLVPAAYNSLEVGDLTNLMVTDALARKVEEHLDSYRLLTTTLLIREPSYVGVQVKASIVLEQYVTPDVVRRRAIQALYAFLCPLPIHEDEPHLVDLLGADWQGWPFGQTLHVSELHSLLQQLPGVLYVQDLHVGQRRVLPVREQPKLEDQSQATSEPAESQVAAYGGPLSTVERMLAIPDDALICSLDHDVQIVNPSAGRQANGRPSVTRQNGRRTEQDTVGSF